MLLNFDEFLYYVVTDNEMRISYVNVDTNNNASSGVIPVQLNWKNLKISQRISKENHLECTLVPKGCISNWFYGTWNWISHCKFGKILIGGILCRLFEDVLGTILLLCRKTKYIRTCLKLLTNSSFFQLFSFYC